VKGWAESEFADRSLMAPCGSTAGSCGVYLALATGDTKFRALLGSLYGRPRRRRLPGLHAARPAGDPLRYCRVCPHQRLRAGRGFYCCHQCADWPCALITGSLWPPAAG